MGGVSALKQIITSYKHLYLCGAVILDSPFYVQWGKDSANIREQAERIHDTSGNAFDCFLPILENPNSLPKEPVISLLAGITTHICSDAAFHPFVCHFSGSTNTFDKKMRRETQTRHHTLETFLDLHFANKGFFSINTDTFSRFLNAVEIPRSALLETLCNLFSRDAPGEKMRVKKAVFLHAFFQSLFHQTTLKGMLHALNLLPGINLDTILSSFYPVQRRRSEALFSRPIQYLHPVTGDSRYISIRVLETEALRSIQIAFQTIEEHLRRETTNLDLALLRGPNLYTGMTGLRLADMRYFNSTPKIIDLIEG